MDAVVKKLLNADVARRTLAEEAGYPVRNEPGPLFKLLVLAQLTGARISVDQAVGAAGELFAAGGTTARGLLRIGWQARVDALDRGGYARFDEGTATQLGEMAELIQDKYNGDLRRLPIEAERDTERAVKLLRELPGVGATAADIFCREAQAVWPWLRPYLDPLALKGAERLGLPADPAAVADGVGDKDVARLAAGLVRIARDRGLVEAVTG